MLRGGRWLIVLATLCMVRVIFAEIGSPITAAPQPEGNGAINPPLLRSPTELPEPWSEPVAPGMLVRMPMPPPLGFAGPSGILPREQQTSSDFVPIEDRWRIGLHALGSLRQRTSARRRLSVRPRRQMGFVQPKRAQRRLSDHRPAHVFEHHGHELHTIRDAADSRRPAVKAAPIPARQSSSAIRISFCFDKTCRSRSIWFTATRRSSRPIGASK